MGESATIVQFNISKHSYFNYSFCVNNYPFIESISWQLQEKALSNVCIEITSQLGLFKDFKQFHDEMQVGKHTLQQIKFNYNLAFLKQLTERDIDSISLKIFSNDELIYETNFELHVLPLDFFGGINVYPELLASYVLANHPVIYKIKNDAVKILEQNKLTVSFEGYQSQNKERVLQMVAALYQAMVNLQLVYSAMPASFEQQGQRIRLADQVLTTGFGNCIDVSLLFAACLEAINLNPILVITQEHAFVGVWLEDLRFNDTITHDVTALTKRIASGIKEIALIEATNLCKGTALSFKEAMLSADAQIMQIHKFSMAIDVKNAQSKGIHPLPFLNTNEISANADLSENFKHNLIDEKFEIGAVYDDLLLSDSKNLTKQKIWERKLLDLSLRNNLLNIRFTKSMLQLVDLNIHSLEDTLANGKTFTIQPNNSQPIAGKYNLYSEPLHESDPLFQFADSEFKYNRLYTHYHQIELDAVLTHLFRNAKLAEEENGKSTLYLGIGLLKWIEPKNNDVPRLAPLLLIPVELSRKSVNNHFTLRSREDETMINITLLEYLRQEYQLNLSGLEELPMDDAGVDVKKVLTIFRKEILNLKGWDILEQCVLGTFSFNKLILWQDISKFSDEIQKSPIVKSLIDGKLHESLNTETLNFDLESLPANWLTLPIATDHSQLEAVLNANANNSFVLHGPPGTGKSQTITNIIADALANNKKVLFVAAKKAALDVVHNRLDKIGLGPFCLELHSNKSKKSDVLVQLDQALNVTKQTSKINFKKTADKVDLRKNELSEYINLLHKPLNIGWTVYDTISYLDVHEVTINQDLILQEDVLIIDAATWSRWKDWSIQIEGLTNKMEHPAQHPLRFISLKEQNFSHKNNIQEAIVNFEASTFAVSTINKTYNLSLKEPFNKHVLNVVELLQYLQNFEGHQSIVPVILDTALLNILNNWVKLQTQLQAKQDEITTQFNTNILTTVVAEKEQIWNQSKHVWFLPKWFKQRNVKQFLNGFSKQKIKNASQVDTIFSDLSTYNSLKQNLQEPQYQNIQQVTNQYLKEQRFNVDLLQQHINQLVQLNEKASTLNLSEFQHWLENYFEDSSLKSGISVAIEQLKAYEKAHNNMQFYLNENADNTVVSSVKNNLHLLEDWITYNHYKQKAVGLNLTWFIYLLDAGKIDKKDVAKQLEQIIHLNLFVQTLNASTALNTFDANVYEALIEQYKKAYNEFTEITKNQLLLQLSNNVPNVTQEAFSSSEIGILQKAIRNKARGISIRKLFDQIPTLLPRLKPCMLMSPISVAQYFDVDTNHFDLVIFDEASQLPTSEAISALARAKQAIIVGDPKQMPPTSFFTSNKIDEDNMELEDLESILDDTLAISIPSKHLLRHYRSKHESLIAFSNASFYENKLLTFPSADDLNKKVTFEYIDGNYDKGSTRTNKIEAEAIVSYIKKHLLAGKKESLGVVTFNQTQQVFIEDLLQKLYQENPLLEEKAMQAVEPVFIKNLENVQGDERDIILFSVGYGPDQDGKLSMNFGPLNREGGWRRLNVAVTRARLEMKVFSSLKADQIDLNRTQAEGVKGLKGFLNFAEKGLLPVTNMLNEKEQKKNLIEAIAKYLGNHQLEVKTNIGTSDYRLDIGIVDPENKDQYVLGILIDGENYIKTQTTNDRELLIPSVLESLGWNIYRIWTLDWIKNKEQIVAEIKLLIQTKK